MRVVRLVQGEQFHAHCEVVIALAVHPEAFDKGEQMDIRLPDSILQSQGLYLIVAAVALTSDPNFCNYITLILTVFPLNDSNSQIMRSLLQEREHGDL